MSDLHPWSSSTMRIVLRRIGIGIWPPRPRGLLRLVVALEATVFNFEVTSVWESKIRQTPVERPRGFGLGLLSAKDPREGDRVRLRQLSYRNLARDPSCRLARGPVSSHQQNPKEEHLAARESTLDFSR